MIKQISFVRKLVLRTVIIVFYLTIFSFLFYFPALRERFFDNKTTLNIFTFSEFFTTESIRRFEEKYQVNVHVNYYDTNEELFAKFKITGGKGYDVIIPSDYMVEKLKKEDLLADLDHAALPIIASLDPAVLNWSFDPQNKNSLPIQWVTYGILYKKDIFKQPIERMSLKYLFEREEADPVVARPYKVAMVDDGIEAILLAGLYRYQEFRFDKASLAEIQEILIKQRPMVASYLSHDIRNFLATDLFQLALTSSMNARRMLDDTDAFDFKIPQEGCLFVIENIAIPKASANKDMAYAFINFMLSEEISAQRSAQFGSNPANKHAYKYIHERYVTNKNFFPDQEIFSRLHLTSNQLPLQTVEEIWLKVKNK